MSAELKNKKGRNKLAVNLILIMLVIGLAVFPLMTMKKAEFGGSDDQATNAITQIDKNYKRWFSIWIN